MSTAEEEPQGTSLEPADVERRKAEAIRLHVRGMEAPEIAAKLGIHPGSVRRYLRQGFQEWKEARIEALDEFRDREAERIKELIRLAFDAWDRSTRPALVTKTRAKQKGQRVGGSTADEITTDRQERHQVGDKGFLELIKSCSERLCEMYGSDAPKQTQITGLDGGPITLDRVLTIIAERPPSPPAFLDPNPPNVIDVDSCARLIEDPNFMPDTLVDGEGESTGNGCQLHESSETFASDSADDELDDAEPASESEPAEFVFRSPGE